MCFKSLVSCVATFITLLIFSMERRLLLQVGPNSAPFQFQKIPADRESRMATEEQPDPDNSEVQTIQPGLGNSGDRVPFYRTTIEPVLVLFVASLVLSQLTTQLFIHSSVSERYNNDSMVNATTDTCKANATSPIFQTEQLIQEETSKWVMSFTFALTLPGVASTLVIGSLTDIYGRKLGILLSIVGSLVRAVITIIVMVQKLPLHYLFFGYLVEGFTGSFGTMIMAGFSYVSDISDSRRKRSVRITITEASMAMGSAVASLGGGFWIDAYGYTGPIVLVIALQSLNILLVLLLLQETVIARPSNWKASLLSVRRCFNLFYHDTPEKRRWKLITIMLAFFFTASAALVETSLKTMFLLNIPLCWDSVRIGFYNFISTATSWIMIIALVRGLQKFAIIDRYATFIGYAGAIVTFSLLTMADNNAWMYTCKF